MSKRTKRRRRKTREANATSGRPVMEAFGDIIDPNEYLTDEPGWGLQTISAHLVARKGGANAPAFRTDEELAQIRGAARLICDVSVNAKCAMQNLGNYVVGQGFDYSVVDKRRIKRPEEEPSGLAREASGIVEEFLDRTKYGTAKRRKRLLWAQRRDGEYFATLWHVGGGRTAYRVMDPGFFITPPNVRDLSDAYPLPGDVPADWTFGIHTPDDDYEEVHGYYAQFSSSEADFEYMVTGRVVHAKVNVDEVIKRGLSDFYWVYTLLQDAAKLLRNGVRGASVLAAIAAIVESPPGTKEEQITSFKTGKAVSSYSEPTQRGGRTQYVNRYNAGSFLYPPNGAKYHPSPLASQGVAGSIIELEQAVLRIIGSNWCMPEYMISSDASNANYSSTLVAGSPFVKFVEALQGDCAEEDEELLWGVLQIAWSAGYFARGFNWHEVKAQIEIKVEAPQASIQDQEKENRVNQTLSKNGLLSKRTWATRAGLDYEQEVANGAQSEVQQREAQEDTIGLYDPRDRDKDGLYPE